MDRRFALLSALCGLLAACSTGGDPVGPRDSGTDPDPDPDAGPLAEDAGRPPRPDSGRLPLPNCSSYPYTRSECSEAGVEELLSLFDTDSDGLSDFEELCVYGSDPCRVDTNGNGVSDLIMVAAGIDPRAGRFPSGDFAVVLPYEGPVENRTLRFGTEIQLADVYFLIDTTGSMGGALSNVQRSLGTIATRLRERIPDVELGVGRHDDFPFGGYGGCGGWGAEDDVVFGHIQDITGDVSRVQAGLDSLRIHCGGDGPESYVEALYQTATGAGGSWRYGGATDHVVPPRSCPAFPDEVGFRRGYPCFRPGALPIVVLVGDNDWHNGPSGVTYSGITPAPATFDMAAAALNSIGGRFIGVWLSSWGGSSGVTHAQEMARRTGSVDASGMPLVYTTSDGGVSDEIVTGIETLVGRTPQEVTTRRENVAGNPGDFDATLFIQGVVPVEGYRDGIPGARPGISYSSMDETTFYGVIPGTVVDFRVEFHNDVRPPGERAEVFRARIFVVGNGVAVLDERQVYIVVPPDGGVIVI